MIYAKDEEHTKPDPRIGTTFCCWCAGNAVGEFARNDGDFRLKKGTGTGGTIQPSDVGYPPPRERFGEPACEHHAVDPDLRDGFNFHYYYKGRRP